MFYCIAGSGIVEFLRGVAVSRRGMPCDSDDFRADPTQRAKERMRSKEVPSGWLIVKKSRQISGNQVFLAD